MQLHELNFDGLVFANVRRGIVVWKTGQYRYTITYDGKYWFALDSLEAQCVLNELLRR
jgi:hypothetical protein